MAWLMHWLAQSIIYGSMPLEGCTDDFVFGPIAAVFDENEKVAIGNPDR
jgi:hypothetical protein